MTTRQTKANLLAATGLVASFFMLAPLRAADNAPENVRRVDELLEPIRAKYQMPGLAALVLRDGQIVAQGAVGRRSVNSDMPVTLHDRWHLGSDTKSMTTTLAAVLVERHKIRWTTTVAESFPRLAEGFRPQYRDVTLEQLLWHRGGVVDNDRLDPKVWDEMWKMGAATHAHRLHAVELILSQEPLAKPGEKMIYTNLGYIVAGAMLENAAGGKLWEKLITDELFDPLKMNSAGFGAPGKVDDAGKPDNALGHEVKDGKLTPMDPAKPNADNPPVLGPAGTVHCTLADWAKYIQLHSDGARGEKTALLDPAAFKKLHTPPAGGDYAMGWAVSTRPWAHGVTLSHAGSNTMWYCVVWMAPELNAAVLVATNRGGDTAEKGTDAAAAALIEHFLPERPSPASPARKGLPAKADLVADFEKLGLPPRLQGDRGDCSLFAVTALAEFESARGAAAAAAPGQPTEPRGGLSMEFLVWASHKAAGTKGDQAMFYEAVHGLNALGICVDELMPYEKTADPNRKPSAKALADAAARRERWQVHWIRLVDVQNPLTDAQLEAIKAALAAGHPVACGLRWPASMKGYEILDVPPPDKVSDGHSIAFAGYEDDPKKPGGGTFTFRNSFGPKWGNKGYGVMSYAYARVYANDALWLNFGPANSEKPIERFEAESLAVLAHGRCDAERQDMGSWEGPLWSRGAQLFCNAQDGGFVELAFDVRAAGRYRVRVLATASPDYGVVRLTLDGRKKLAQEFNLYSQRVSPAGSLELGTVELAAGRHKLHVASVGKPPGSTGFSFGLDAIDLLTPP